MVSCRWTVPVQIIPPVPEPRCRNAPVLPIAHTCVTFSAPTSCQTDTPVWTAVSTVHSQMYPNNDISHELSNFNFIPLVHSKVKSASSKSRYVATIESEPETETYPTKNLPRTNELFQLVKPAVRGTLACNEPVGLCNPETTPLLNLKFT